MLDREDITQAVNEVCFSNAGELSRELGGDAEKFFELALMLLGANLLDRLGEQ
jgi:hypothetical protein